MKLRQIITSGYVWLLVVVVTAWGIYLATLSRGVYYGDSAEFIVTALTNGVPHPPGFPLFVAVAHQFSKLPFFSVAGRVNLVSAVFGALSAGAFFGSCYLLTRHRVISLVSALFYTLSPLFWIYSTVAEVFALNNFFLALLLFLSIYAYTHSQKTYLFPLITFVFGLGLTGHQVLFFFTPALVYLFLLLKLYKKPRVVAFSLIAFALGQLPQFYLWYAASGNPPYNWGDPDTLDRLIRHILRLDYGTFKLGGFTALGQGPTFAYLPFYAQSILGHLHVFLLFIPFGLYYLWQKVRPLAWIAVISFVVFGPAFLWYTGLPMQSITQKGVGERFFMQSIFFLFFISAVGMVSFWKRVMHMDRFPRAVRIVGVTFLLLMISLQFFVHYPKAVQNKTYVFAQLARNMFLTLPENSLFLVGSATTDTGLMGSIYLQQVEKLRADIMVVNVSLLPASWYRETLKTYHPDLKLFEVAAYTNRELATRFCQESVIQTTFIDGWSPGLNPGESKDCTFVQRGLLIQLLPKNFTLEIEKYKEENDALWKAYSMPSLTSRQVEDLRTREVLFFYSQARVSAGITYLTHGKENWAKEEFAKAWDISADNWFAASYLALSLYNEGKVEEAISMEHQALSVFADYPDSYLHLGVWYAQKKEVQKARYYLTQYLARVPDAADKDKILGMLRHLENN